MSAVLTGVRVIEFAGLGPGPFCGMMLADHGAEVIRLERLGARVEPSDPLARSRLSLSIDMKSPLAIALIRDLCRSADAIIEGYRPGVMERLGLGPEVLLVDNPKMIYGRITGWGQTGPLSHSAGHDINYIAISGALHTVGLAGGKPVPPVNYVGDFGGGGLLMAFGIVSALLAVRMGGSGQVVDAAMSEGASLMASMVWGLHAQGLWRDEPGVNLLDGGAHFYGTYTCSDGKHISIASIEPKFYSLLLSKLGLDTDPEFDAQMDPNAWGPLTKKLAEIFARRSRAEWNELLAGTDVCFAPVMSLGEAPTHPHNVARGSFVEVNGAMQPAPAPRFSSTKGHPVVAPTTAGADADQILLALGYPRERIASLRASGVIV